ncbi:hypothetical protein OS493_024094 [Desmophyllum pertusum]|uniref:TRAF-type domain-containing protein n=1 Tax=Desmophyllum pertusum TaxID=174260 RepID=A0A9W9ZLS8_9CNID|nr:hypothetical protein OS493_024094 [Desmophyllum pertusum]
MATPCVANAWIELCPTESGPARWTEVIWVCRGPARNLALQAIILNFTIKCPNGLGCLWMGKLESMSSHKGECKMEMVECQNSTCTAMVYRVKRTPTKKDVPTRVKNNSGCRDQAIAHFGMCKAEPQSCPFNCGAILDQDVSVERHFLDNSRSHLDLTVAKNDAIKDKQGNSSISNSRQSAF